MSRIRKLSFFRIFLAFIFIVALVSCFFFFDKQFLIKPLPQDVTLKIRMDAYGDGHFGAVRKGGRRHRGIDLLAALNTPVLATKSGIVTRVAYDECSGNYVIIKHVGNLKSYYIHLSEVTVRKWQPVRQGQVIGKVGNTGNAKHKGIKPHLHFEIREKGVAQNILKRWKLN